MAEALQAVILSHGQIPAGSWNFFRFLSSLACFYICLYQAMVNKLSLLNHNIVSSPNPRYMYIYLNIIEIRHSELGYVSSIKNINPYHKA